MRNGREYVSGLVLLVFLAAGSAAQAYPDRPVTVVVPYSAGGPTDVAARLVAQQLATRLKGTFLVDNRTGGGGNIGNASVARAEPDGYTLLLAAAPLAINKTLFKRLEYDPEKDFAAVALIATAPLVLVARPNLPASSIKELVALSKGQSTPLNYMSQGVGSAPHIGMELLKKWTGMTATHIPYRGSAPALNDLMAGQIDVGFDSLVVAQPLVSGEKIKAIAITGASRSSLLPNVPTMAESGFPDVDPSVWYGIVAPARTPAPIVDSLSKTIVEILADADVRPKIEALGAVVTPKGSKEFAAFLDAESKKWGEAVIASGASVE